MTGKYLKNNGLLLKKKTKKQKNKTGKILSFLTFSFKVEL